MICGLEGRYRAKLRHIRDIVGLAEGVHELAAMSLMITTRGVHFITDTHVQADPTAEAIADTVLLCAKHVERFGLRPRWRSSRTRISATSTRHHRSRCAKP